MQKNKLDMKTFFTNFTPLIEAGLSPSFFNSDSIGVQRANW